MEKINVKDCDLIENITPLFELPIILMGMGDIGKRTYNLLQKTGINVSYIYDRVELDEEYKDTHKISIKNLKIYSDCVECLIIIATEKYCEEILKELNLAEVSGYICTWYGVQCAIELNIDYPQFDNHFRKQFVFEKNIRKEFKEINRLFQVQNILYSKNFDVLIYQPGKVGSTSLQHALEEQGIRCLQIHWWMRNELLGGYGAKIGEFLNQNAVLLKNRLLNSGEKIKIITAVREPIGREFSYFLQEFHPECIMHDVITNQLLKCANKYITNNLKSNREFEWFNKEIREATGIDIYSYPFDKEQGYALIENEHFQILVLKMEKMNENVDVLRQFVGKDVVLKSSNVGLEKPYKYIYQQIKKEFRISKNVIEKYYLNNLYMDHFYTLEEKKMFLEKWKNNIIGEDD